MGEVAEAAGVARATLYRYFPTREALLEELARSHGRRGGRTRSRRRGSTSSRSTRRSCVRSGRSSTIGDAFVVLARERQPAQAEDFERRVARPLRALVERGQASGDLRDDVPSGWLLRVAARARRERPALRAGPRRRGRSADDREPLPRRRARRRRPVTNPVPRRAVQTGYKRGKEVSA